MLSGEGKGRKRRLAVREYRDWLLDTVRPQSGKNAVDHLSHRAVGLAACRLTGAWRVEGHAGEAEVRDAMEKRVHDAIARDKSRHRVRNQKQGRTLSHYVHGKAVARLKVRLHVELQ
jgi:hypothetical protein